jgi:hypothetical protein
LIDTTSAVSVIHQLDLTSSIYNTSLKILNEYGKYEHLESQKEFAIAIKDSPYKQFLFAKRKNDSNMNDLLMTYIKKKVNDQSSVREVRLLLGMNCVW